MSSPRTIQLFPTGEIGVIWDDGAEQYLTARDVRLACPCASCVDELTGRQTLVPERVPASIRAESWQAIGRYAIQFRWSDGHQTGIYTFAHLRQLAPPVDG